MNPIKPMSHTKMLMPMLSLMVVLATGCGYPDATLSDQSASVSTQIQDCIFEPTDKFEPRSRVPKGPYKGECFDTRQRRPAVLLNAKEAKAYGGLDNKSFLVANVSHDDQFWVARIPKTGVTSVIFQLEYFPAVVPAGHVQIRLQFSDETPVKLIGQLPSTKRQTQKISDLVISMEAVGQPGYQYDIFNGMKNYFGAVYRVTSIKDKVDYMVVRQDHFVEQWELNMTQKEMNLLLKNYLKESDKIAMNNMYHTLFVNCTNEIIRILDTAMDYTIREQVQRFLAKATEFYPNIIRTALIARGLLPLDQSTDLEPLHLDPSVQDMLEELSN